MHYDGDKQRQDQTLSFTDVSLAYVCHFFNQDKSHTRICYNSTMPKEIIFAP